MTQKNKINNFKSLAKKINLPLRELNMISESIFKGGGNLKIVGGGTRDIILKKKISSDPDLVCDLIIQDVIKCLKKDSIKYVKTGFKYGCITIFINNVLFEITSLRRDIEEDGRWTKIKHTKDWFEDASRRDFTINAIYCDLNGNLFDPLLGIKDLKNKKVKFIGNCAKRIEEDYLRILRFFRFSLIYSNKFNEKDLKNCIKYKSKIKKLSFERRISEFKKIIVLRGFEKKSEELIQTKVFDHIFEKKIYIKNLRKFLSLENKLNLVDVDRRIKFFLRGKKINKNDLFFKKISKALQKRIIYKVKFKKNYNSSDIIEKLFYHGTTNVLDQLLFDASDGKVNISKLKKIITLVNGWKIKKLPVNGNDIINAGVKRKILIGNFIKKIEIWWVRKMFKPSKKDCLNYFKKYLLPRG